MDMKRALARPLALRLALSLLLLLLAIYCGWAYQRASTSVMSSDSAWPRRLPYPDGLMRSSERFIDSLRPSPPNMLKLRGEFPMVRFVVALLVLALLTAAGIIGFPLISRKADGGEPGCSGPPDCA